jgi:hypothetical protein
MTVAMPTKNPLAVDFLGLKRMSKEFLDALPTLDLEALDNGFKAFKLGYLKLEGSRNDRHQAAILFTLISGKFLEREAQLLAAAEALVA